MFVGITIIICLNVTQTPILVASREFNNCSVLTILMDFPLPKGRRHKSWHYKYNVFDFMLCLSFHHCLQGGRKNHCTNDGLRCVCVCVLYLHFMHLTRSDEGSWEVPGTSPTQSACSPYNHNLVSFAHWKLSFSSQSQLNVQTTWISFLAQFYAPLWVRNWCFFLLLFLLVSVFEAIQRGRTLL